MGFRRSFLSGFAALAAGLMLMAGCGRRPPAESSDITPSFSISRARTPLGSAVEITYTWKTGADFKKLDKEYRSLVHFLDSHRVMLFDDDHVPVPPPSEWQSGSNVHVHAHQVRSDLSLRGRRRGTNGLDAAVRAGRAPRAQRRGCRAARVLGGLDRAASTDREHLPGPQVRLAQPRGVSGQSEPRAHLD